MLRRRFEEGRFIRVDHTESGIERQLVKAFGNQTFAERMDRADVGALEQHELTSQPTVARAFDFLAKSLTDSRAHLFGRRFREGQHEHGQNSGLACPGGRRDEHVPASRCNGAALLLRPVDFLLVGH